MDEKRFYVPGAKLVGTCPGCGKPYVNDFGKDPGYLSNPKANTPIDLHCYCFACEHEWTVKVQLDVSIALIDP